MRIFTFQYVSINTVGRYADEMAICNLHSNMFLLIRWGTGAVLLPFRIEFTFQYVSINTRPLLTGVPGRIQFTFQYVSINTKNSGWRVIQAKRFTFQYVSINTGILLQHIPCMYHLHSNMFLLILLRIYFRPSLDKFTFQYVSINTCLPQRPFW